VSVELEYIWSRVQAALAAAVEESTYRIWLEPLRARGLSDGHLVVEASPQACGWIGERFGRVLQQCATSVLGAQTQVELVAGHASHDTHSGGLPQAPKPAGREGSTVERGSSRMRATSLLGEDHCHSADFQRAGALPGNPKLTFDQFVIGDCNRLAHAAALTVAEMPAQAYNPLFICGPPGVGKTHLLGSIANLLGTHDPSIAVRCTTGEAFTNEFLDALGGANTETFKARFRRVDVLLIDDVHFLERKAKTEEEFFHTFNALYDRGRQIVLTSDRPPRDLQALEDRLRERFEAGLVADVKPPDFDTRLAILHKRTQNDGITLAEPAVLKAIAGRVTLNVRALEGALIRVVAFSSLTGRSLTAELAQEVLDGLYPASLQSAQRAHSIAEIQAVACKHFEITLEELLSSARTARVAWPRQVAMYLSRELTGESLPTIGRQFGGRDHTTVLYAWRRTTARLTQDSTSRETVEKLRSLLISEPPGGPSASAPDRST
jgi:chromosomal replication initiator protein